MRSFLIFNDKRNLLSGFLSVSFLFAFFSVQTFAQNETNEFDSVENFNKGQEAHEKGDLQTAVKFYGEAIKALPEFPEAEYQRAVAFLSLNRVDEAEKGFRRAVELREDWTLPMTMLGSLLIRKNQFPEAEKVLLKAVALDENNSAAYISLAELRIKTKASESVLRELLTKLKILSEKVKTTASLWAARGAIERALGDQLSAKNSLNRAFQIEPNNTFALFEQIELSLSEKDFTRAVADAQTLVRILPNSPNAKLTLSRTYIESGNETEALKILDKLDGKNPEVATLKNLISVKSSNDVSALEKMLGTDTKNVLVLAQLCNLTRTANPVKSLEYCRRASEAEPSNINHAIGYGAALVQAKQFDSAVALFRKLLQSAPDNFTVRANLATALFQLKKFAEAKTEYLWLTEKKPDLAIAYYFLAISHDSLGEFLDAMANYQQFLKLADAQTNQLEIEKVKLRLPILQKQIKEKKK